MKDQSKSKLISAILMTVIGVLFIVLKSEVISIGMTILGVMLIVQAILDLINKKFASAVIRGVIGALVIVLGWLFVTVALYIMAAVLLICGVLQLIDVIRSLPHFKSILAKIVGFIQPAVYIVIAVFLFMDQGKALSWVFILGGVFFIVQGALALIDCLANRNKSN